MNPSSETIVVGGGPAALGEVLALRKAGHQPLVISQQFGGCMEMLGAQTLQSYVSELSIADSPVRLQDFLGASTACCPSGWEYSRYIRACFDAAAVRRLRARVERIRRADEGLEVTAIADGSAVRVMGARVILATGLRPRVPDARVPAALWKTCFEAYEDLRTERLGDYAGRTVAVIGSGNTAFQIARAMTRVASEVLVLLKDYAGVFPIESSDRFALRAPSLQALELAAKTAQGSSPLGPLNPRHNLLCPLWIFAYAGLAHDAGAGELRIAIKGIEELSGVVRQSTLAARRGGLLTEGGVGGALQKTLHLATTTLVSAIGVTGNFPDVPAEVIDSGTGFAQHEHGRTAIPGLFVAGALAGYASVNQMQIGSC